ncbi:MAG: VWA domain-containing protein, partial [Halobacterium sp.]
RGDGVPDFGAAREHVLVELVRLVSDLRSDGVTVPATGLLDAARALAVVGLGDEQRVAAALRATLVAEQSDLAAFEDAFPEFWQRLRSGLDRIATAHDGPSPDDQSDSEDEGAMAGGDGGDRGDPGSLPDADPPELDADGDGGEVDVRIPTGRAHAASERPSESGGSDARRYSASGGSELVDDAVPAPSGADVAAIDRFVDALATLPGRRTTRAPDGPVVDARAALRASLQTGGAPLDVPREAHAVSEVRCCLLVDVSGSVLDTIDRGALLALVDRLASAAMDARVFLFDTDVVEATETVSRARGSTAAALRAAEVQWGGGTKIGAAFDAVRRDAPHAVDHRTVVVVVSDGLDVGDPDLLADGVTWLADRAGAVVWLNPLAVSPSFEPASRGMATVEPYLDALFGFAAASDLAAAAEQLERRGLDGPVGYEYDPRNRDSGERERP